MSKLDEDTIKLIKGIINSALKTTKHNGNAALEKAPTPFNTLNTIAKPNKKRVNSTSLKLKEDLAKLIRVPMQRTDADVKDVGDDTEPFVSEKDKVNLRRRKSFKKFINSVDDE